jgi:hypothetical protein
MTEWLDMGRAPKDGTEIIVLIDSATVPIVRSAWWRDAMDGYDKETFEDLGLTINEDDIGWWSYRHSVTQEKLEGYDLPVAWMPMPATRPFMR